MNDTATVTAPDGSITRLSQLIPASSSPTSSTSSTILQEKNTHSLLPDQSLSFASIVLVLSTTSEEDIAYSSLFDETSSDESTATVSSKATLISSSHEIELTVTTQLASDLATLSTSSSVTLSADGHFSEPNTSSTNSNSSNDKNATPAETERNVQIPENRRPHQAFASTLTEVALNNTKHQICGPGHKSSCGWIPSITSRINGTYTLGPRPTGTLTLIAPTSLPPCTTLQDNEPITEYSIVYTATVTFLGNSSEYTPPYPTISTPNFCETQHSGPTYSKVSSATAAPASSTKDVSPKVPPKDCSPEGSCSTEKVPGWSNPTGVPIPEMPSLITTRTTVTFVTTDKNPAVVFTTKPPPKFGKQTKEGRLPMSNKQLPEPSNSLGPNGPEPSGDLWTSGGHGKMGPMSKVHSQAQSQAQSQYQSQARSDTLPQPTSEPMPESRPQDRPQTQRRPDADTDINTSINTDLAPEPTKVFLVTARGQEVIVNDKTFSNLKADQTTTVTVDSGIFTIRPTELVGEGATVKKPQPIGTAISVVSPTSTALGGVRVTVSGTEAIVDGTRLKIPLMGTTTKLKIHAAGSHTLVEERQISIAPGRVMVDGETLTYTGVGGPQTDVIIVGGEMVTVAGKSVFIFHSTTLIYGLDNPGVTQTIDDDTITVGPAGVVVDRTTLGGYDAEATDTKYRIVGGATITKVNPSYVIVDETTFIAGPGAKSTTKETGGETITIGPSGVIVGTMTVKYPFGASTVTTINARATASNQSPVATGSSNIDAKEDTKDKKNNDDDDSGTTPRRSGLTMGTTLLCIAVGVWAWV